MPIPVLNLATGLLAVAAVGLAVLYVAVKLLSHKPRPEEPSEKTFLSVSSKGEEVLPLPLLTDAASTKLSVVIPCYNETKRLPKMLDECLPYLQQNYPGEWELLLVDDGSKDGTAQLALDWARKNNLGPANFRVCSLVKNRGKGGAVTHGMNHARGDLILFADADGASKFSDVSKLIDSVRTSKAGVAVGSRAHLVKSDAVVKRTFIRNLLMYGLHTLLYIFGIRSIADTQCGFKLFTRSAARKIFPYMHTERWIFDVEALILAMHHKVPISEVAITWHEVEGSKIDLARDSVLMAVDLVVIRFAYLFGIYSYGP